MVPILLNVLRIRWIHSKILIFTITKWLALIWKFFRDSDLSIAKGFNQANILKKTVFVGNTIERITIICVVTAKDFLMLPNVIRHGVNAVGQENVIKIHVIVPQKYYVEASVLLNTVFSHLLEISTDEEVISVEGRNLINSHFKAKSTWVLQQLVKFESVRIANSNCLILDADTLILNNRYLRVVNGVQALTPTEEFNQPYYTFLEKISKIFSNPTFSFVPHHIIVQQDIFKKMCTDLALYDVNKLIMICIQFGDISVEAPLCVDYELYAQYLFINYPHRFVLIKWSNISISRNQYFIYSKNKVFNSILKKLYNSISFHSWS